MIANITDIHIADWPHLVTGIGATCAIALAQAGASLCLVQRPGTTNLETYNAIAALGRTVKTVECDLADLDGVRNLFARALEAMDGQIHVLVNCAGIQRRSPAVAFSEQDWNDVRCIFTIIHFSCSFFPAACLLLLLFLFLLFLRVDLIFVYAVHTSRLVGVMIRERNETFQTLPLSFLFRANCGERDEQSSHTIHDHPTEGCSVAWTKLQGVPAI
jgi:hypothetical protein